VTLTETVDRDIVAALKAGRRNEVDPLRLLKAAMKNSEVAKGAPLTNDEALGVVRQQVKQRHDSIAVYERVGRPDRAGDERAELQILQRYLPPQVDDAAIQAVLTEVLAETGAAGPGDVGKVMPVAMARLRGQADGRRVNALAREMLQQRAG
jgi:uncharacterized protein YqeY